jgi:hypothetical protein
MSADTTLTCRDCNQAFTFTSGEQEFYASRGFSELVRCADSRGTPKSQRDRRVVLQQLRVVGILCRRRRREQLVGRRSRGALDVHSDVLELRTAGPGAIPAQRRQAGVLFGLLRATPGRW